MYIDKRVARQVVSAKEGMSRSNICEFRALGVLKGNGRDKTCENGVIRSFSSGMGVDCMLDTLVLIATCFCAAYARISTYLFIHHLRSDTESFMPRVTLLFSFLLILLGIVGYAGNSTADAPSVDPTSDSASTAAAVDQVGAKPKRSITALIPTFTGGLLLVFGAIAINEKWRMHAMHGAVLIGLLGFLAAGSRGASGVIKLMSADADVNSRSLFFVCAMAILCGIFVALCVRSFVGARRRQREENVPTA